MHKTDKNNKYSKLKGQYSFIATSCGCSSEYVRMILQGRRAIKTSRATTAVSVVEKAEKLLELLNPESNNN